MSNPRHTVIPRTMSLIFDKDEVLLIKASDKKDWAGMYNPIGGHVEAGEDIIQSAMREIKEETGLEVDDCRLRGVVHAANFFGKNIIIFVTQSQAKSKLIQADHDEGELAWIQLDKLDQINIHEDVEPIINFCITHPDNLFTATSKFDDAGNLLDLKINMQE